MDKVDVTLVPNLKNTDPKIQEKVSKILNDFDDHEKINALLAKKEFQAEIAKFVKSINETIENKEINASLKKFENVILNEITIKERPDSKKKWNSTKIRKTPTNSTEKVPITQNGTTKEVTFNSYLSSLARKENISLRDAREYRALTEENKATPEILREFQAKKESTKMDIYSYKEIKRWTDNWGSNKIRRTPTNSKKKIIITTETETKEVTFNGYVSTFAKQNMISLGNAREYLALIAEKKETPEILLRFQAEKKGEISHESIYDYNNIRKWAKKWTSIKIRRTPTNSKEKIIITTETKTQEVTFNSYVSTFAKQNMISLGNAREYLSLIAEKKETPEILLRFQAEEKTPKIDIYSDSEAKKWAKKWGAEKIRDTITGSSEKFILKSEGAAKDVNFTSYLQFFAKKKEISQSNAREYLALMAEDKETPAILLKFQAEKNNESFEQKEFEDISNLKLEDAIALLQNDPLKLKLYLQFAHPEITEEEVNKLTLRSFSGLNPMHIHARNPLAKYEAYENTLPSMIIETKIPLHTEENTLKIKGRVTSAKQIAVEGTWNRTVEIDNDGKFEITIPLKGGEQNEIYLLAIDKNEKQKSEPRSFVVEQTNAKEDIESFFELISAMKDSVLEEIQTDPKRSEFLIRCSEKMLIKKFTKDFASGLAYVENIIKKKNNPIITKVLKRVIENLSTVEEMNIDFLKENVSLYFFQKYCVLEILRKMAAGENGVILANEPGLGKTITALTAIANKYATIISPNSVTSAWNEEAAKFLKNSDVLNLQGLSAVKRKKLLKETNKQHILTNIEFLRKTEDEERFDLLSRGGKGVVVYDEAHSLSRYESSQTQGAMKLDHEFLLLLSASPFKDPKTFRRMMYHLHPNKIEYSNDKAFEKAFKKNDPQALKAMSLLKDQSVIRFRKKDVLEEFDPSIPLDEQSEKLPVKEYLDPKEKGQFTISNEQSNSIYEMFMDWDAWVHKYNQYIPKNNVNKEDGLIQSNGFSKRHALRQTINNPEFVGLNQPDFKAAEIKKSVEEALSEDRKIVIFCRYNAQANKYKELFAKHNPALYTGMTSKNGMMRNEKNKPRLFKVGEDGYWELDKNGVPIDDENGNPMMALDYERVVFQNNQDCKILISTYAAGAVGTTFTAGKAIIFDDLPVDYTEQYQSEDRIHRIDNTHKTHHSVKYYKMMSMYPDSFLDEMKNKYIKKESDRYVEVSASEKNEKDVTTAYEKFFSQGTFDEVHDYNLNTQSKIFHLMNDGIISEQQFQSLSEDLAKNI